MVNPIPLEIPSNVTDVFVDPQKMGELSKEQLVDLWEVTTIVLDDLQAQLEATRHELMAKMDTNGEIVGSYALTRARRINFPDVTLDQAKELGAIKLVKDMIQLKQLWERGVKIKHQVTEYLLIKKIKKD